MADRYVVSQRGDESSYTYWILGERDNNPVVLLHESLPNARQEALSFCDRLNKKIGEPSRDLAMVEVRAMLYRINRKLNEFKEEVRIKMSNKTALDQAVDGLTTAATNKVAEDQVLDTLAADEAAETARVEAITGNLNTETAAEQAAVTPAAAATTGTTPAAAASTETAATTAAATGTAAATTTGS